MEEKIKTTVEISKESRQWLEIYKAVRNLRSLGAALEDLIADKRTIENLEKGVPVPKNFLEGD